MSFGYSVGDIIAAARLAQEIYQNCFTASQAARELLPFFILWRDSSHGHMTVPSSASQSLTSAGVQM